MQHSQSTMSDQQKPMIRMRHVSSLGSQKAVRFLIAIAIGAALLCFSAITFIQTVIALILVIPVLVISSPISIPAGALLTLMAIGFLFSGCCCVAALAALPLIYKYVAGKHPLVADQIEYARMKIASAARDMKEIAKECGKYGQHKAEEATHGS